MQRCTSTLLVLLFLYNSAGYVMVFTALQYRIRKEMKTVLRQSVPEEQLQKLAIPLAEEQAPDGAFLRIHEREFRYRGSLYDIVRSERRGDTTIYYVINDVAEEKLFALLDGEVRTHMGTHTPWKHGPAASALSSIIKDALPPGHPTLHLAAQPYDFASGSGGMYTSFHPDNVTPPPEAALL